MTCERLETVFDLLEQFDVRVGRGEVLRLVCLQCTGRQECSMLNCDWFLKTNGESRG